jgi:hypothetical protein
MGVGSPCIPLPTALALQTLMSELGHGVIADNEHAWDVGSCSFSRESSDQPGRDNHRPQCLQLVSLVSRPAIFDHQLSGLQRSRFRTDPTGGRSVARRQTSGDPRFKYPITGIACCARAASGRAAAAPPSQRDEVPPCHSITSSASASNFAGISSPSDLAVLRLIVRMSLVGCCTGRSTGLAPLRIFAA